MENEAIEMNRLIPWPSRRALACAGFLDRVLALNLKTCLSVYSMHMASIVLLGLVMLPAPPAQAQTMLKYMVIPGSTLAIPPPVSNSATYDLPGYGPVQVSWIPTSPALLPAFSLQNTTGAFNQTAGVYSWGTDTQNINMLNSTGTKTYTVTFKFLSGVPNLSRLILVVAGLADGTTATVSQSVSLAGEFTFPNTPRPSAPTSLTSGNFIGSAYSVNTTTDDKNTGWALFKVLSPIPIGTSGGLSVKFSHVAGDGIGVTLGYVVELRSTNTYAAKFICGVQPESNITQVPDAQAGRYSTKINVHNNTGFEINFRKKIIRLHGGQVPIDPQFKIFEALKEDQAMEVVCRDIYQHLNINIPPGSIPPYIEGFVILQVYYTVSPAKPIVPPPDPLDVVGIYTYKGDLPTAPPASGPGSGVSIEVVVYPAKSNSHILN